MTDNPMTNNGDELMENPYPSVAPTFLERSRKALAGGFGGLVAAVAPTVAATAPDGFTAAEGWVILSAAVAGFVGGFATVYLAPANAE